MNSVNQKIAQLFTGNTIPEPSPSMTTGSGKNLSFSYIFFSDVREEISNKEKYQFVRELVAFADQSGFDAICFPERHFYEFGSIYANNGIMAAYFAPLTKNVRLRASAVTATLHHQLKL